MKSSVVVTAAALALALPVSQPARADPNGEILNDEVHRYRLELTVAQKSVVGGKDLMTTFCLSPARENKVEICLGTQGHSFLVEDGRDFVFATFNEVNNPYAACRCERPVVLVAEQPFCWPMNVSVPKVRVENGDVAGFVTILEDVHEIGGTAESCVHVDSNHVPLTITGTKVDTRQPPKESLPRLRS